MKSDSQHHYAAFEFFPLYDSEFAQLFRFLVIHRKISSEPKAIAKRLFTLTPQRKFQTACLVSFIFFVGKRHDYWLNEPITPFSFFPPFAYFLTPQN
jgi:hypothetical protein